VNEKSIGRNLFFVMFMTMMDKEINGALICFK